MIDQLSEWICLGEQDNGAMHYFFPLPSGSLEFRFLPLHPEVILFGYRVKDGRCILLDSLLPRVEVFLPLDCSQEVREELLQTSLSYIMTSDAHILQGNLPRKLHEEIVALFQEALDSEKKHQETRARIFRTAEKVKKDAEDIKKAKNKRYSS